MPPKPRKELAETDKQTRIAIVNSDKCKPKRCRQECKKSCPVVRMGIEVVSTDKIAKISEELCIGCGICVKKCPFEAITIINLSSNLQRETTHRYGQNSFKLHRLPTPRPGEVLGLVGTNGIGKSTALKILVGKLKPNLGKFSHPPNFVDILTYFRDSELQNYFIRFLEDELKALIKPQYVDQIPNAVKGKVRELLEKKDELNKIEEILDLLDLKNVMDRSIADLSGGELQRFACAVVYIQDAEVILFDEPSSYLDVKQPINAAQTIRSLLGGGPNLTGSNNSTSGQSSSNQSCPIWLSDEIEYWPDPSKNLRFTSISAMHSELVAVGANGALLYKLLFSKPNDHWKKLGIPEIDTSPALAILDIVLSRKLMTEADDYAYTRMGPDDKFCGILVTNKPLLLIKDVELQKRVLIKDFDHFVDRRTLFSKQDGTLSKLLVSLQGDEWKGVRASVSPTFTTGKIRLQALRSRLSGETKRNDFLQLLVEAKKGELKAAERDELAARSRYAFMPFGMDPRNCIGMRFGLIEVKSAIAHMVHSCLIFLLVAFAAGQSCTQCSISGHWYCGGNGVFRCVQKRTQCVNGSTFVLPPHMQWYCPGTTTPSSSSPSPSSSSSSPPPQVNSLSWESWLAITIAAILLLCSSIGLIGLCYYRLLPRRHSLQDFENLVEEEEGPPFSPPATLPPPLEPVPPPPQPRSPTPSVVSSCATTTTVVTRGYSPPPLIPTSPPPPIEEGEEDPAAATPELPPPPPLRHSTRARKDNRNPDFIYI